MLADMPASFMKRLPGVVAPKRLSFLLSSLMAVSCGHCAPEGGG